MKAYSFIITFFISISLIGQAPKSFKYQATARDASGSLVSNQNLSIQISILQGSASGDIAYQEVFNTLTDDFGLINIDIGTGNTSYNFNTIDWGANSYFIKLEMDLTGGTNYQDFGTSQLLSVPYALHANSAETATNAVMASNAFNPLFPNGFQNITPITVNLSLDTTYTVPSGKILYILNLFKERSGGLLIEDIPIAGLGAFNRDGMPASGPIQGMTLSLPILVNEGETLRSIGDGACFNGYLIDK